MANAFSEPSERLLLQYTVRQLGSVYSTLVETIAAIISTEDSSIAVVEGLFSSTSTTLTTASGCARDDDGSLRVQFYASAQNITREIDGLLASRRRLQSTPCSSTDGTSVASHPHTITPLGCAVLCYMYMSLHCVLLCCSSAVLRPAAAAAAAALIQI